ncbi:oxidoreductase [Saccharopolyspora rhizosphaerae]|uniref:Oxidoreductase n=1 Tax=Saccharopolyspora rhizosphaerae TaxID=2492662 RepID=A0A426K4J1_9PSEU|nr:PmoA family protein [Saccharopolyspora rhizosphaerae]RRO20407.1 oxidoreductase [Saccharopolyspora rhizosphaerae]
MTGTAPGRARLTEATTVVHEVDSALSVRAGEVELLRYTYRDDAPARECPAPHFHPLRALHGGGVTGHRPHDHRWHKGLAMTASHLSGQNFWGGGTYTHGAPGTGYVDLPNVGSLRHRDFREVHDAPRPGFVEDLDWITADGQRWIDETRSARVEIVAGDAGAWQLELRLALTNVAGRPLEFGSPTVFGRELAGYCGLFWRGPRSFTGGEITSPGGDSAEAMMGTGAPWLAFTGLHDGTDHSSTLLFLDHPDNPVTDRRWFVRSRPFPAVNPSLAFHRPLDLADGDVLRLAYRVLVFDGARTRQHLEAVVAENPWEDA